MAKSIVAADLCLRQNFRDDSGFLLAYQQRHVVPPLLDGSTLLCLVLFENNSLLDFPGYTVGKNPPSDAGDTDSIPGLSLTTLLNLLSPISKHAESLPS